MNPNSTAQRIVLAKVGLDGHDRGIKVVARGLRDAGFHVIYSGLWQRPEAVVQTVLDEDADWLGISLLSGAHLSLVPPLIDLLRARDLNHVRVIVGGIIPEADVPKLNAAGVQAVFGPGTPIAEIAEFLRRHEPERRPHDGIAAIQKEDRRALAQLLTLAARGEPMERIPGELSARGKKARVIAFTGSGGVGKSSLIGRIVELLRARQKTVAILCCDPESPLTGGALLGDRVRIARPADDPGVFIRSLATPGGQQAIARHLDILIELLKAYGFDFVLLETVGAGQGDTAVRDLADVLVLLLQPESGDDLQWEKAGILEVADVVVIHKADLPGADRVAAAVDAHVNAAGTRPIPVLKASAAKGEGLEQLWSIIEARTRSARP